MPKFRITPGVPHFFLALTGCLFFINSFFVIYHSIDIPSNDTWSLFDPGILKEWFDIKWMTGFHNEHRIVTTRFAAWVLYKLNGLNLVHLVIVGQLYFALAVTAAYFLLRKEIHGLDRSYRWLPGFGLLLTVTPMNWENHAVPFNMQFHASMFFSFLYLWLLFGTVSRPKLSWIFVFCVAASCFLGAYSFAGGVIQTGVGLGVFVVALLWNQKALRKDATHFRKVLAATGLSALIVVSYFYGYEKPAHHPELLPPTNILFWRFYAELLSLGFGLRDLSTALSTLVLLLVHIPGIHLLYSSRFLKNATHNERMIFATWAGLLFIILSVASSRSGFGLQQAKQVRYAEWGLFCVPFTLALWCIFLSKLRPNFERAKNLVTAALATALVLCFWDEWNFSGAYVNWKNHMIRGQDCAVEYYKHPEKYTTLDCPYIASGNLVPNLEHGKKRNFSFYRTAISRGEK